MSPLMIRYVGLDVHKRVVQATIVDQTGTVVPRERFALNRRTLNTFATKVLRPTDQVALEVTTNCWAGADALQPHVARVVVSNPMATKAIAAAKIKTDKVDADVLAQLLRCDFLPAVWQPDEATRRLRELTGRRSVLVCQRTMMRNRIHSVLAMRLVEAPLRLFNAEGLAWLAIVELDEPARLLVDSDLRQLEFLGPQIDALDLELAKRGYQTTEAKLRRLRVKATGQHRKSGVPKGQKAIARQPGQAAGSRVIKALAQVGQSEGLPMPKALSPGERRLVAETGCADFVAQRAAARIVPRRSRARRAPTDQAAATQAANPACAATTGSSSLIRRKSHGGN